MKKLVLTIQISNFKTSSFILGSDDKKLRFEKFKIQIKNENHFNFDKINIFTTYYGDEFTNLFQSSCFHH